MSSDWIDGAKQGALIGTIVLMLAVPGAGSLKPRPAMPVSTAQAQIVLTTAGPAARPTAWFNGEAASTDARRVADWVARSGDNAGLAFAILDKREAAVFVFDAGARLVGASPVLLGAAPGDASVAGIGERPIAAVRPEERTTPAGRFVSRPGKNASGEDVVWVDYDAAVSMHRVRLVRPTRHPRLSRPRPRRRGRNLRPVVTERNGQE